MPAKILPVFKLKTPNQLRLPKTNHTNYGAAYYIIMTFSFKHFTLILSTLAITLNICTKRKNEMLTEMATIWSNCLVSRDTTIPCSFTEDYQKHMKWPHLLKGVHPIQSCQGPSSSKWCSTEADGNKNFSPKQHIFLLQNSPL